MSAKTPTLLGPYEILAPLGRGGMGVVYRARHRDTGQLAAVKTVRVPDESLLSSIRREIHALARIHHPGIVRIMAEGMESGLPWYAMELLEGVTLRHWAGALAGRPVPTPSRSLTPSHGLSTATVGSGQAALADPEDDRLTAQVPGSNTDLVFGGPLVSPEAMATAEMDAA